MTLIEDVQQDFSAGSFQGVDPTLIPRSGFYAGRNVLLDADGGAYKRGGSRYLSTSAFNAAGLRFILDAYLAAGPRTVIADSADFGVLDASEGPINLGGAGLTSPRRAAIIDGVAVIGGGPMYAGSRKGANYTTGTVSVTQGSTTVTGSGTTWNTLVDAGMFLQVGGSGRYYVVKSITDTTHLELTEAYEGSTGAGNAYVLSPLATAPRTSDFYVAGDDRLVSLEGDEIRFSRARSPGTAGLPPVGNSQWQTFDATDFHKLPGGVKTLGGYFIGPVLYVFTTGGVFAVENMAYDLTDADGNVQQRLTRVSPDLVLWANEGLASFGDAVIVPATDGVWLFRAGALEKLSVSIDPRYLAYVRAGYKPGLASVYRNHYLLPILSPTNVPVETLTCRLDRPTDIRGIGRVYPWTWQDGAAGAGVTGYTVRIGATQRTPMLIAAGSAASARVLDCSGFFEPSAANKHDHDGSTHEFDLTMRDVQPGALNIEALVRKVRARYELVDAATDDPKLSLWYSVGVKQDAGSVALWGSALWGTDTWGQTDAIEDVQAAGQAPEDDGRHPFTWKINERTRRIRLRLRSSDPSAKLVLRNVEIKSRRSAKG